MKSNKQRRKEILERRRLRAESALALLADLRFERPMPEGAILADRKLLDPSGTYAPLPGFYVDRLFICRDCGVEEVWTAKQQKWWYENAQGNLNSTAVRCRPCRIQERDRRAEARRVHLEGVAAKQVAKEQNKTT